MVILYESQTFLCELENDIIYLKTKEDRFEIKDVEPVKENLSNLFYYIDGKPYLFSFIFDVSGLSYGTLFRYCKSLSKFFIEKREKWKIHQQVSTCITDKTIVKTLVQPIVNFTNTGKPFKFVSNKQEGIEFINLKKNGFDFDLNFSELDISNDVNLDSMLNEYETSQDTNISTTS